MGCGSGNMALGRIKDLKGKVAVLEKRMNLLAEVVKIILEKYPEVKS